MPCGGPVPWVGGLVPWLGGLRADWGSRWDSPGRARLRASSCSEACPCCPAACCPWGGRPPTLPRPGNLPLQQDPGLPGRREVPSTSARNTSMLSTHVHKTPKHGMQRARVCTQDTHAEGRKVTPHHSPGKRGVRGGNGCQPPSALHTPRPPPGPPPGAPCYEGGAAGGVQGEGHQASLGGLRAGGGEAARLGEQDAPIPWVRPSGRTQALSQAD